MTTGKRGLRQSGRLPRGLLAQVLFDELQSAPDNLARPLVIIFPIKAMHPFGLVNKLYRDVLLDGSQDKLVQRIIDEGHIFASPQSDHHLSEPHLR
jgi:hypothetical protein